MEGLESDNERKGGGGGVYKVRSVLKTTRLHPDTEMLRGFYGNKRGGAQSQSHDTAQAADWCITLSGDRLEMQQAESGWSKPQRSAGGCQKQREIEISLKHTHATHTHPHT